MRITVQFSIYLINKPGVLVQVVSAIADAKVNIVALTIVDSHENGVLRVVADNPDRMRQVLAKLNLPTHETEVLAIEMPNRAGALSSVLQHLAEEHINIEYAYVTAGAPGGKTTGILRVSNLIHASKVLTPKIERDLSHTSFRSTPTRH